MERQRLRRGTLSVLLVCEGLPKSMTSWRDRVMDRARAPPHTPHIFTQSMLKPKLAEKAAFVTIAGIHISFRT